MRLRKIKNALERLEENEKNFILEPHKLKGKWSSIFNNSNPIYIEIGCGKGNFITTLAKNNPDINYIGIEKYDSVLLRCSEKAQPLELDNLRLIIVDATNLLDYFEEKEIDNIYLNFSDPWPKTCHSKRRLTSETFLDKYKVILKDDGKIMQKTDNRLLFEFSLESFNNNNWCLEDISLDLHHDSRYPENVMTEFEEKWSQFGPIYRLVAKKKL